MCRCAGVWREEEEEGCGRWRMSEKTPALVGLEDCSSGCVKRVPSCDLQTHFLVRISAQVR